MDRYVYDTVSMPREKFNKRLHEFFDDGWEVAGKAVVETPTKKTNWNTYLTVPIRKKIHQYKDPIIQLTEIINDCNKLMDSINLK